MALSRRQFVGLGGLFVASALSPLEAASSNHQAAASGFDASVEVPVQYMSRDTFTRLIGTRFTVHTANSRTVPLTLIAVDDMATTPAAARGSSLHVHPPAMVGTVPAPSSRQMNTFALRFRGSGKALTQDSYIFESGSLGKIALFIVPCSKNMRIPTYTAIISHLQ